MTAPSVLDVLEELIRIEVDPAGRRLAASCGSTAIVSCIRHRADRAMRVGGRAAFGKDIGTERHFRDARAAAVAPTSDALDDFVGRANCGLPRFG